MPSAIRRHAGWVAAVATLAVAALCAALGVWQLDRARETRQLAAAYERLGRDAPIAVTSSQLPAAAVALRRVTAHGTFDPRYLVFVDNRVLNGVPGYHVVMPLRLEGGDRYVLVNRGWIAAGPDRSRLPEIRTPTAPVDVNGIAVVPEQKPFELSSDVMEGRVWENLTIARFRHAYPMIAIQPFVIEEDNDLGDGLARVWEKPDFGLERHYGYALQWFLLGATALVIYGVSYVRRRRSAD